MRKIQNRIKALRRALGLKQEEFGQRIGAKQSTVTAYECGNRTPMDTTIVAICKEFNVNEVWLRTGEGEMFRERSEDEELAALFGQLLSEDDAEELAEFKRRIIRELLRMSPEGWQKVVDFAKRITKKDGS